MNPNSTVCIAKVKRCQTYFVHISPDTLEQNRGLAWWRHQMETFSALLALCAGNSPVPGEFPSQRPVARSLDVFFDLRLNKQLSKQSWGWCFETLSCPLWRHYNARSIKHQSNACVANYRKYFFYFLFNLISIFVTLFRYKVSAHLIPQCTNANIINLKS